MVAGSALKPWRGASARSRPDRLPDPLDQGSSGAPSRLLLRAAELVWPCLELPAFLPGASFERGSAREGRAPTQRFLALQAPSFTNCRARGPDRRPERAAKKWEPVFRKKSARNQRKIEPAPIRPNPEGSKRSLENLFFMTICRLRVARLKAASFPRIAEPK